MGEPIIRLQDCSYVTNGPTSLEILRIASLIVNKGESVAIFGPSGSGKSTLFHILAGLLPVTTGEVEVVGGRLDKLSEYERDRFRARHIGFVFQSFNLLPGLTALENILLAATLAGPGLKREAAAALLGDVGLEKRLNHCPHQLSIGEQQRVAVARALSLSPDLILADEPTGSVDQKRALEIIELLQNLAHRRGSTLLVISHDPVMVERFPRKISMIELNKA